MLYRSIDSNRLEYAHVRLSDAGGVADGTIVGLSGGQPLRVRHELTADSRWHVRNVSVEVVGSGRELLSMSADEDGIWRRVDGGSLIVPIFNCFDIAIALTPVPTMMTLRRLALEPREAAIVSVACVAIPSLDVTVVEHRYTCLAIETDRSSYRFENFDSGERAMIRVDADGAVAEHEAVGTRVWPLHAEPAR